MGGRGVCQGGERDRPDSTSQSWARPAVVTVTTWRAFPLNTPTHWFPTCSGEPQCLDEPGQGAEGVTLVHPLRAVGDRLGHEPPAILLGPLLGLAPRHDSLAFRLLRVVASQRLVRGDFPVAGRREGRADDA